MRLVRVFGVFVAVVGATFALPAHAAKFDCALSLTEDLRSSDPEYPSESEARVVQSKSFKLDTRCDSSVPGSCMATLNGAGARFGIADVSGRSVNPLRPETNLAGVVMFPVQVQKGMLDLKLSVTGASAVDEQASRHSNSSIGIPLSSRAIKGTHCVALPLDTEIAPQLCVRLSCNKSKK